MLHTIYYNNISIYVYTPYTYIWVVINLYKDIWAYIGIYRYADDETRFIFWWPEFHRNVLNRTINSICFFLYHSPVTSIRKKMSQFIKTFLKIYIYNIDIIVIIRCILYQFRVSSGRTPPGISFRGWIYYYSGMYIMYI